MRLEELFEGIHLEMGPLALCVASCGWRFRLSRSDEPTLHYVLQGRGVLKVDGAPPQELRKHTLALVPAGSVHSIQGEGRPIRDMVATPDGSHASGGLVRLVAGPTGADDLVVACGRVCASHAGGFGIFDLMGEPLVLDFSRSRDMRDIFDHLLDESQGGAAGNRAMIGALMQQCLILVFRELCEGAQCQLPWLRALENPRLRGVIAAVLERPHDTHSLTSLAMLGMSRSAFARDFTRGLGLTPKTFVRQVRLRQAAQLLRGTDLTITAVAHHVGFSSRSHFSHAFADEFGQAPSDYRAQHWGRNVRPEQLAPTGGR